MATLMPTHAAILVGLALVVSLGAQADPVALTAAAERALKAGKNEDALLLLWQARAALSPSAPAVVRDAVNASAAEIEPQADAQFAARTQACQQAARLLLEIARAYRSRNWHATAAGLCAQAMPLDAAAAAKELAALQKAGWSATAAAPADAGPKSAIEQLGHKEVDGKWTFDHGVLCSPQRQARGDTEYYLTAREHGNQRLAVSIETGNEDSMGAMLFGVQGDSDYFIVEIETWKDRRDIDLTLWQWHNAELTSIRRTSRTFAKVVGSHRLEVLVRDQDVTCLVDGVSLIHCTVQDVTKGRVGFFVSGSKRNRECVRFADFELTPLPENAEADAERLQAEAQKALVDAARRDLEAAERLLQKKQPEAAASQLRAVVLGSIDDVPTRTGLQTAVDKQLAAADPLHGRRRKACTEAGKQLAPIAEGYAAAGWPRVAARFAAMAAALDPQYGELANHLESRAAGAK